MGKRQAESSKRAKAAGTLETPSFSYHFRLNDAQVVTEVATQIEVLYTTLRDNLGLVDTPRVGQPITPIIGQKLAIEVSLTQAPGRAHFEPHNYERFVWEDRLIVASPALYLAPIERTDAELLVQSVALPLLAHVLTQASEQYQLDTAWRPLINGLRLWQVWDLDLPLAAWREEVVTWVYTDLPNARPGQSAVLPEHYPTLCASHKLWLPSPMAMNIILLCAEVVWEDFFLSPWGWYDPLTRLEQLSAPLRPGEYIQVRAAAWRRLIERSTLRTRPQCSEEARKNPKALYPSQ